ncbi:2-succinyl-5-enolpyruvyl-6-hydroxy-3-cyclohexene-1-carboxylic-acid synthase [Psychromonas sp. GE-S-Ul-11]|uniref:2-succinyl-5-enolpyruvyl-6-hydroxy-3- cyclohexene-1-carboxylic-acid synthase n=2 Tax=Psychromonas sp. GE-S-Ul-11 TaxID=3241170 RepID=UPI00390CD14C
MDADNYNSFSYYHANINLLWASLLIEELTRHGIKDFCIAPGSRSTPLTLAVANHAKTIPHVHFDERGLGFFALGLCKASAKPVVIITTSGTAVANLYPAIIEARQSHLPLIVLSADRPPELIDCAANQAIEQQHIFAHYPVFFKQIPSPTTEIQPNYLLSSLNQGVALQEMNQGPIHFNISFTEPLYPKQELINFKDYLSSLKYWTEQVDPFIYYYQTESITLSSPINLPSPKTLVIAGRLQNKQQALAIEQFCIQHQLPLFADVQSQLQNSEQNILHYDLLLMNQTFSDLIQESALIIQFSDQLISKRLTQLIDNSTASLWVVSEHQQRIDPTHSATQRFITSASTFVCSVEQQSHPDQDWLSKIVNIQKKLNTTLTTYTHSPNLNEINSITYLLNDSSKQIMLGNSLVIRIADMFACTAAQIYSNRGASGIDGLIATAVGIAKQKNTVSSLVIGDTSFLYDLNSLALFKQLNNPFIILLLNNDGGGIFNLLPVPAAQQQQFYQNPHGLTFAQTCAQFSINYTKPRTFSEFKAHYQTALMNNTQNCTTLIEVCTDNTLTARQLDTIKEQIKNAII